MIFLGCQKNERPAAGAARVPVEGWIRDILLGPKYSLSVPFAIQITVSLPIGGT